MFKKLFTWLDERLGLGDMYTAVLDRPEPKGNWWNTLGSASMFLFVMQGLTGIFLSVYYTPSPDHAYDSIQYIMNGVAFGWLIRGIHHWGASLMVIVVLIHMIRVFVTASYKYPRELTWLIGSGLLICTLAMGFTGYLLPWNQKAYWATTVGTSIAGSVPWIGPFILKALRGGPDFRRPYLDAAGRPGRADAGPHFPHHQAWGIAVPGQGRLKERRDERRKQAVHP
jgi:quinol-cytochrome oxidoreductase complex cytochrome b subunit